MHPTTICMSHLFLLFFFFFNDTPTTQIYTLSLHDALPISTPLMGISTRQSLEREGWSTSAVVVHPRPRWTRLIRVRTVRSEEHTSELQSRPHLVCRLLLEKKKKKLRNKQHTI